MKAFLPLVTLFIVVSFAGCAANNGNEAGSFGQRYAGVNLNGTYTGAYAYDNGAPEARDASNVSFRMKITQQNGDATFRGAVDEAYSGFGTKKDNRLWAEVRGEVTRKGNTIYVHFEKTYLYFNQEAVVYDGVYNPATRQIEGKWKLSGGTGNFKMRVVTH